MAAGERLWFEQEDVEFVSHAIEVRLYAEDPARGFLPATGKITELALPQEEDDVRIDAGVSLGDQVTPFYDPMIAKIITSGSARNDALRRMREVLGGLQVGGVATNLDFLRWLVGHPQFEMGNLSTRFIERYYRPGAFPIVPLPVLLAGSAVRLLSESTGAASGETAWRSRGWRMSAQGMTANFIVEGHAYTVTLSAIPGRGDEWHADVLQGEHSLSNDQVMLRLRTPSPSAEAVDDTARTVQVQLQGEALYSIKYGFGERDEVYVVWDQREYWLRTAPALSTERMDKNVHLRGDNSLESPMPGKVLKVLAKKGESVVAEQPLVIVEAMKMEFTVRAPHDGRVADIKFQEGDQVAVGDVLLELDRT